MIKHIVLFVLTILSTFYVGGFSYGIAIMTILLAHEMGHFFASRCTVSVNITFSYLFLSHLSVHLGPS